LRHLPVAFAVDLRAQTRTLGGAFLSFTVAFAGVMNPFRCLSLGALGLAAVAWPRPLAAADWLKVQTPDLSLYSDASKRDVTEFAVQYTAFRHVFNELFARPGLRAPPARIILFRKSDTLKDYVRSTRIKTKNLGEFSGQVGADQLFALALSGDRDLALRLAFEDDTTWMLGRVGYFLPLWMSQGTGEVLSTLWTRGQKCEFGETPEGRKDVLEDETMVPWGRFFEVSNTATEYKGKKGNFTGIYQAQSWLVMNAVLLGGTSPRGRFARLEGEMKGDSSDLNTMAAFLGVDAEHFTDQLWRIERRSHPVRVAFDAESVRAGLQAVPAPPAEVHVELSELLGCAGKTLESETELDQAEALAPALACVKEGRAYFALRQGDGYAAARAFREAIAAGSVDPQAYLSSAAERLADTSHGGGAGGPEAMQALGEIRRGLELAPGDKSAYRLLSQALFVAPTVTDKDIAELTPALADPEEAPSLRFNRALLYERTARPDEAEADLKQVQTDAHASADLQERALAELRRVVFETDRVAVEKLLQAGQLQAARERVARAALRIDGTTDVEAYAALTDRIGDYDARNKALALYQAGKWQELGDFVRAYLDRNPHGTFARSAAGLQRLSEQKLRPASDPPDSGPTVPAISFIVSRHWHGFDHYFNVIGDELEEAWRKVAPPGVYVHAGMRVTVTFEETSDGTVTRIVRHRAPDGIPDAITQACIAAVKNGGPYDKWNDSMVIELGDTPQRLIACFTF